MLLCLAHIVCEKVGKLCLIAIQIYLFLDSRPHNFTRTKIDVSIRQIIDQVLASILMAKACHKKCGPGPKVAQLDHLWPAMVRPDKYWTGHFAHEVWEQVCGWSRGLIECKCAGIKKCQKTASTKDGGVI